MRDAGHRTPDIGQRTSDGEKSKNNISTPQGGGHNDLSHFIRISCAIARDVSDCLAILLKEQLNFASSFGQKETFDREVFLLRVHIMPLLSASNRDILVLGQSTGTSAMCRAASC